MERAARVEATVSTHRERAGRPKRSPHASRFRGVYWNAPARKWQAQIYAHGRKRSLGYYDREEDAAAAYTRAVARLSETGGSP